jgi:hypothetical protein
MVSWARLGATFLGCSGKIGGSGGSAAVGVFILIDVSKTTNLGGTSGTQNVRFCDLQICVSLAPKNGWMICKFTIDNLQTRKSGTPFFASQVRTLSILLLAPFPSVQIIV